MPGPGGGVPGPWGCLRLGVPGPGEVPALGGGGCLVPGHGGGFPACTEAEPPCEQNDRQV